MRFLTNFGALNLELHCDLVPKTCENFMKHCQNGYYDGTKFHRSIRNFMVSWVHCHRIFNSNAFRDLNFARFFFSHISFVSICLFYATIGTFRLSADPGW